MSDGINLGGFETSPDIGKLAAALAAFHTEAEEPRATGRNPHFKSTFTTLGDVTKATKKVLAKHGLSVVQLPVGTEMLITMLVHSSGQWMRSTSHLSMERKGPQARGSAISYERRYALKGILSLSEADDDGEGAEGRSGGSAPRQSPKQAAAASKPAPQQEKQQPKSSAAEQAAHLISEAANAGDFGELEALSKRIAGSDKLSPKDKDSLAKTIKAAHTLLAGAAQ